MLDRPSPRSLNTQNYLTGVLERFETPASSEDGKLNISGDRGDLLPPH